MFEPKEIQQELNRLNIQLINARAAQRALGSNQLEEIQASIELQEKLQAEYDALDEQRKEARFMWQIVI